MSGTMTEKAKHTPGPWVVFGAPDEIDYFAGIDSKDGVTIILFGTERESGGIRGDSPSNRLANARLIASAPEMLEACEAALLVTLQTNNLDDTAERLCSLLRAAIAKATEGSAE